MADAPVALWAVDKDGLYTVFEGRALQEVGLNPEERIGQSIFEIFADRPDVLDPVRRALAGDECSAVLENRGAVSETRFSPQRDTAGNIIGVVAVSTLITERVRAEADLRRVNRALRLISECNQALVRATDENTLLQDICYLLVEHGGYRFAWVGYAQRDSGKTVWPIAHAGVEDGYLDTVNITWSNTPHGRGPTGTAIRTGKPVVSRFIATDPVTAPWRENALKHGYQSSFVLPLAVHGETFGALTIFSSQPDAFDESEQRLLSELAGDLAFGIIALRDRVARERGDELIRAANERLEQDVQERTAALEELNTELEAEVRERIRTEDALRESELKYRIVADNTYDWEFWLDAEGQCIYVSPSCERISGYSARQFAADPQLNTSIVHPEDAAAFQRHCNAALRGESTPPIEFRIMRHDGELRWIEQASLPVFDSGGRFLGTRGSNRDITERKRAQDELASVALFPAENPSPVLRIGRGGQLLYVNAAGQTLLREEGCTPDEPVTDRLRNMAKQALEQEEKRETDYVCRDGHFLIISCMPVPSRGYVNLYARDISERRRIAEKLREREAALRVAQRVAHIGHWFWDPATDEGFWSEELFRIYGRDPNTGTPSYYAEDVRRSYAPQSLEALNAAVQRALQNGSPWELELELDTPDGRHKWLDARGEADRNGEGKIVRLYGTVQDITQRKQAEEALREAEERLKLGLEATNIGMWHWDVPKNVATYTPTWYTMLGYEPYELPQSTEAWEKLLHPDDLGPTNEKVAAAWRGDVKEFETEVRMKAKSGEWRWILSRGKVTSRDAGGKPLRMIGTHTDITALKETENSLRWELQVNAALANLHSPLVSASTAVRDIADAVLKQAQDLTGSRFGFVATIDSLTGECRTHAMTGDARKVCGIRTEPGSLIFSRGADGQYHGLWGHCLNTRQGFLTNAPAYHPASGGVPDGHIAIKRFIGVPVHLEGKLIGALCLINSDRDYTERDLVAIQRLGDVYLLAVQRMKSEEALRESEDRYRSLVETAPIPMIMSSKSRIILANRAFHTLIGTDQIEDDLDLEMQRFVHPKDYDKLAAIKQTVLSRRAKTGVVEFRMKRLNGAIRHVEAVAQPIDRNGVNSTLVVFRDVTEQKHAEDLIRKHAIELERQVAERTAHIQKLERLRVEAEKQAAIGRMAARIAHEINNPLAGIKNSFLLVKKAIPPTFKHYEFVGRIDKELDRIARIVRQMFEVYKPERSAPAPVDVPEVLRDVTALLQGNARAQGVTLEMDASGVDGTVHLHEDSLRQALFSIIQNAIEASGAGMVVRISATARDQVLSVSVADQGCGIPPEVGARIFEPFFTTKDDLVSGGLGLGLSITKGVVEAMGGVLNYESEVGKGTTFQVILPNQSVQRTA
ncbi:MAG TPA: PAS domain S-box protein [bacterium]